MDELRSAIQKDSLKDMLMFRYSQSGDPEVLRDMQWLQSQEGFAAHAQGAGPTVHLEKTFGELLDPGDRNIPSMDINPKEKRQALLFYAQICNGFTPDVDEDNWIALGFCTSTRIRIGAKTLAYLYGLLVETASLACTGRLWHRPELSSYSPSTGL